MKKMFVTLVFLLGLTGLFAQEKHELTLYFESDQFLLSEEEKARLTDFLNTLELKRLTDIEIIGHTDAKGSYEYNLKLSEKRKEEALEFIQLFIHQNDQLQGIKYSVRSEAKSESIPIATNDLKEGRKLNRRVDIKLTIPIPIACNGLLNPIPEKEEISSKKTNPFSSTDDFFKSYISPKQTFSINAQENTKLTTDGKVNIYIFANSLKNKNEDLVIGNVQIEITEFLNRSDMLLANLHTMSNKRMLESGGMFLIEAFQNGEKLNNHLNQAIEISIPFEGAPKENMITFLANETDMNWIPQDNNLLINRRFINNTFSDLDQCNMLFGGTTNSKKKAKLNFGFWLKYIFQPKKRKRKRRRIKRENKKIEQRDARCQALLEAYAKELKALKIKYDQFAEGKLPLEEVKKEVINNYIMSTSSLGWINCDRFYNIEHKTDLFTDIPFVPEYDIKLIFTDIKSILVPYNNDGKFIFTNIPVTNKVKLFITRTTEEQVEYAIIDKYQTSEQLALDQIQFKPVQDIKALKEILELTFPS